MHVGRKSNTNYCLMVNGTQVQLQSTNEERDLGLLITSDLKPGKQCIKAANKARSVLGMIHRHFKKLTCPQFLRLYKTYVGPHLEYSIQAWSPWLRKDIEILESVQRRATKMVRGMRQLSYHQRLDKLKLTTLEVRRDRGDLIETFKILKGHDRVNSEQFFRSVPNQHGLRGHSMKLFVPRCRTVLRQNFFSCRVLSDWNRLPQSAVDADSVNAFKSRLDKFKEDMGN